MSSMISKLVSWLVYLDGDSHLKACVHEVCERTFLVGLFMVLLIISIIALHNTLTPEQSAEFMTGIQLWSTDWFSIDIFDVITIGLILWFAASVARLLEAVRREYA